MLLAPPEASAVARRTMILIREELLAAGFEVSTSDPGPRGDADPTSLVAVMERQEHSVAVIALVGDPERPGAELWILDRVGPSRQLRRIPVPQAERDQIPEVVAIRASEVLKASALERLFEAKYHQAPPVASAPTPRVPAPTAAIVASVVDVNAEALPFGLEMGVSVLESRGGPGTAALAVVRARARLYRALFARLTFAGLGTRPRVEAASIGSSSVSQDVGLGELLIALRLVPRWRAVFSAGAGALYLRSEGEGMGLYRGVHEARWVAAFDAGTGVVVDFNRHLSLAFEVHGLLAAPHPRLRFDDVETAAVGYPAVLASLTLVSWL